MAYGNKAPPPRTSAVRAETWAAVAELFKVFADPTRVRILAVLMDHGRCAGDIAKALGMTPSAVSHQLRILKAARLATTRRKGRMILYSLADSHVRTLLQQGLDHVRE